MPLLILLVLGKQATWNTVYITLSRKLFGFLCPMVIVFLAWIEQLRFLVLKQLIGTINCSCFGHEAVSLSEFYPDS